MAGTQVGHYTCKKGYLYPGQGQKKRTEDRVDEYYNSELQKGKRNTKNGRHNQKLQLLWVWIKHFSVCAAED